MTTDRDEQQAQAPERIWINNPAEVTEHDQRWWYENSKAFPTVEYVRADVASIAAVAGDAEKLSLCTVHQRLEDAGALECEIGNNCVACSLNERRELLQLIAPFAAEGDTEDSVTVLRRVVEFYSTHAGDGRVIVSYPAPTEPLQPEGEGEPSLEEIASEAAALLEQLNGINGDAVLVRANQMAFALRASAKSTRQKYDTARADGYHDGFRHGRQSRAATPPETPVVASQNAVDAVKKMLVDTQAAKKTLAQEATAKTFEDAALSVWTLQVVIDRLESLARPDETEWQ